MAGALTGKVALVSGAARGIGRAIALKLAHEGCDVAANYYNSADEAEALCVEICALGRRAFAIPGSVGIPDSVDEIFVEFRRHFDRLDILVSNAGADGDAPFLEMTDEEWHRVIDVNLTASFVLGQVAARAMVADGGGGVILYTASISGLGASDGDAHYGVSKAGIINLVQTMAIELVSHRIRVNCVSPGPLDTPLSRALLGSDEAMEAARAHYPLVPMGRLGLPEEIAAAYAYLASDDAAYTTGQNLVIDGGNEATVFVNPVGTF